MEKQNPPVRNDLPFLNYRGQRDDHKLIKLLEGIKFNHVYEGGLDSKGSPLVRLYFRRDTKTSYVNHEKVAVICVQSTGSLKGLMSVINQYKQ
jgi:hypothetical protein